MKILDIKLQNSKVMIARFDSHSSDPRMHDHGDDYQLSIPIIGTPHVEYNNVDIKIGPKQRLITAPGEHHRHFTNNEPGKVLLINLNSVYLKHVLADRLQQDITSLEFKPMVNSKSNDFIKLSEKIITQSLLGKIEPSEAEELEWSLASTLLQSQANTYSDLWHRQVTLPYHPLLNKVIDFIDSNLDTELSIDKMTAVSCMSKFHFIRSFKEKIGVTPSAYVSKKRVHLAASLLKDKTRDITDIAFESGFGSLATFERVFKRHFGVSPHTYRKNS